MNHARHQLFAGARFAFDQHGGVGGRDVRNGFIDLNHTGRAADHLGLGQVFGFDPDVSLAPTNTFQVGFWFNDPNDAKACGFDPTKPTPFNGEHRAGPLAMISVPDAKTGMGPLCLKPDTSVTPASCKP